MGCFAMKSFLKFGAGLAALSVLAAAPVQAATWILDYAATNGAAPAQANLTVTTSDSLNAVGGYDITAIGGDVDGDAVTGLIANPGQPFATVSADGLFVFDNVLWSAGAPALSNAGLFFSAASGDEYNLFSDSADTYELYRANSDVGYLANSVGALSVGEGFGPGGGPVPEPASWTLMILGFGGIGAALRRRRGQAAPA